MRLFAIIVALAIALVGFRPSESVAGGGDFLAGAVTGAAGAIIVNELSKQRRPQRVYRGKRRGKAQRRSRGRSSTRSTARRSNVNPQQRAALRDAQGRLNRLGFNAGVPDGLMGPNTRNAIRSFQASIGEPQTGNLTNEQTARLVQQTTSPPAGFVSAGTGAAVGAGVTAGAGYPIGQQHQAHAMPQQPMPQMVEIDPQTGLAPIGGDPNAHGGAGGQSGAGDALASREQPVIDPLQPFPQLETQQLAATVDNVEVGSRSHGGGTGAAVIAQTPPTSAVLGVKPLDDAAAAEAALSEAGFGDCERTGTALSCTVENAAMTDRIVLGLSDEETPRVHTVMRTIDFAAAQDRDRLVANMGAGYGDLLASANGAVASSEACSVAASPTMTGVDGPLASWIGTGSDAPADVRSAIDACEFYYRLDMPEAAEVDRLSITLFANEPMASQAAAAPVEVRF